MARSCVISSKLVLYRRYTQRFYCRCSLGCPMTRYARTWATNIVNLQSIIKAAYEWVIIKKCDNRRWTMKKFCLGICIWKSNRASVTLLHYLIFGAREIKFLWSPHYNLQYQGPLSTPNKVQNLIKISRSKLFHAHCKIVVSFYYQWSNYSLIKTNVALRSLCRDPSEIIGCTVKTS